MEAVQKFDAKIISAKAILLDIEGTTTSKSFVKDTLFPYAVENVSSFLTSNWETEEVKSVVIALRELASKDKTDAVEGCIEILEEAEDNRDSVIKSVVDNVKWQISLDRKTGPLKTLQGLIWEKGYKDGTIKGHVYDDVPEALATWFSSGHRLYVYSSGSVAAQKLLFGHTEKGSLLDNFSGYFDTSVGGKQEAESYKTISKEIGSDRILFLTDIVKEAEAAVEAGLSVVLVDRDTESSLSDEEKQKYPVISSFADLPLSVAGAKRKSIDNTEEELPPAKVAKTDEATETADSTEVSSAMETEEKTDQVKEDESVSKPAVDEAQAADVPKTNETEKPEESNDVEAMEVDSASSNTKETPVVNEVPECDSTDMKNDETKEAPEISETVKEEVVKTDAEESKKEEVAESKMEVAESKAEEVSTTKVEEVAESKAEEITVSKTEEVTESEVTNGTEDKKEASESEVKEAVESKKEEVTQSEIKEEVKEAETEKVEVSADSETKENNETEKAVENKTENEVTNVEQNGTTDETKVSNDETKVSNNETKVSNDETKTSKTDENEVTTTDAKPADQTDHALKESNGIETNGSNGTVAEDVAETKKPEENGVSSDMVESSTNGTDSDKENDKEEDKKTESVTNGLAEEVCDVKVKKIPADSSPVPAPVEEISA